MQCPKCIITPKYHSFQKAGTYKNSTIFYTAPAKTEDFDIDGTKLQNIKIHIETDTQNKPWVWVLDCAHMEFKHYTDVSFSMGLLHTLAADPHITAVWIIRPNFWIRTTLSILRTFSSAPILTSVTVFEGSNLELLNALENIGLDKGSAHWLTSQ